MPSNLHEVSVLFLNMCIVFDSIWTPMNAILPRATYPIQSSSLQDKGLRSSDRAFVRAASGEEGVWARRRLWRGGSLCSFRRPCLRCVECMCCYGGIDRVSACIWYPPPAHIRESNADMFLRIRPSDGQARNSRWRPATRVYQQGPLSDLFRPRVLDTAQNNIHTRPGLCLHLYLTLAP